MRVFYKSLLSLLGFFSVQTKAETEVNVAGWGTADQSTTYSGNDPWLSVGWTRTNNQSNPWWKLDLKTVYSVNRVTIANRYCCVDWINGAEIRIGDSSSDVFSNPVCAVVSSIPSGQTYNYSCGGMNGRYVIVNIPGTAKTLTFREVGVYVIFPGNLATGKNVTQSSNYSNWIAQRALDFNPGFSNSWTACSSTNGQTNPWWRVDLGNIYIVSRVVITNRLDCCPERINGAEIHIGNSLTNNGNDNPICTVIPSIPAGFSSTFTCNDMEGQYVNILIPGVLKYLTLCEVEVYGEGPFFPEDFCEDEV